MAETAAQAGRSHIDSLFRKEDCSSYVLSMRVGYDGLSCSVLNPETNYNLALWEYVFDGIGNHLQLKDRLDEILETDQILSQSFNQVIINYITEEHVLIPNDLFDTDRLVEYHSLVHGERADAEIRSDTLLNLNARNVYEIPGGICDSLKKNFPRSVLKSASSTFIDAVLLQFKKTTGQAAVLNVGYNRFDLICLRDGKLQLYNSFKYTTAEDLTYFTLFTLENLGFDHEQTEMSIFGEIEDHSPVFSLLNKYVGRISFGTRPEMVKYAPALDSIPDHFYYNLFQQYLCA